MAVIAAISNPVKPKMVTKEAALKPPVKGMAAIDAA